jgi:hypothetical protein
MVQQMECQQLILPQMAYIRPVCQVQLVHKRSLFNIIPNSMFQFQKRIVFL